MTEKLTILGSTGSIGVQSLDVCRLAGIEIVALTANSSVDVIEGQIREFKPKYAALVDETAAKELKARVSDTDTVVLSGREGVCRCAEYDEADTVLNSIVGMAGLEPTLRAVNAGKKIALANKETLVAGGRLVMKTAAEKGVEILPVDSEHSAIFQCLQGMNKKSELKSIILTASGGPFFGKTRDELENATVEEALKHPNWSMGSKITIDSATMMNKGLELIEAVWLFDVEPSMIDIVVHRQSVLHSAVEYTDNSVIAQLGVPDMRIPIQYALTYPDRFVSPVRKLSLADYGCLTFEDPDSETFEAVGICRKAIELGGLFPCIANGANESANLLFRQGRIGFLDIPRLVDLALQKVESKDDYTLEDVLEADKKAKQTVMESVDI